MFSTKNLIVVVVALYLIIYVLKDNLHKMVVGGGALVFLCMNIGLIEGLEDGISDSGFDDEKDNNGSGIVGNNTVEGDGARPGPGANPKILNMGPYDGLYSYLSSQGPIKMKLSDQAALNGPPVDGVKGSPEKMFMWANNVTSPLCCPSTFSTSTGCVCSTKNQRDFVAARGMLDGPGLDEIGA